MMKNWKKIAILGIVLVIFAAAFIYLSNIQNKSGDDGDSETDPVNEVKLVSFSRDKMVKIILEHGDSKIVLTREEKEVEKEQTKDDGTKETVKEKVKVWVTPDFDVDSSEVDDIALSGETVTTKRRIDENPQDVSVYGLDDPYIVTFVSEDGKEEKVEIGDKTPTQDSYYVRRSGDTAVYTISSYRGDILRSGKLDILNKNLHKFDNITSANFTSLNFEKDGELVFESYKDSSEDQWYFSKPLKRKVDATQFPKFLEWLAAFKVSEYVEENPSDLAAYGLDDPKYVFNYNLKGREFTLKLGSKSESKHYAMMEGHPYVFNVSASDLNFVDFPMIDLMDRFIYIPTIYDVEKLVIEIDNRVDTLLINANKEDPEKEEFYFNGRKIDDKTESQFRGYYQGAIGLTGDRMDLAATPEGNAEIRLTYTMREAKPDKVVVVELIPTEDGYGYYLMKNGEYSGLIMGKRKLDDPDLGIRSYYNKLIEALSNTNE